MAAYNLSAQLHGHEGDVCGICICGDVGVATSSRDKTVKFWTQHPEKKCEYVLSKTLVGHSSFVGPMVWAPPSDRFPEGAIVSGGMDTLVLRWNLHTGEVVGTMKGHTSQVTGLAIDDNGDIISSSMDCTLRRWRDDNAVEVLETDKVAVQTVLKLPSGELFTGSSDSTIKLYNERTHLHTFSGHADTVRCLAHMPGIGILSASHDGTIKLWALTGQPLLEMIGHTSLVYSVDAHSSGLIASGSEDRSIKIWKDGICVQTIEHPGCIWDAKFLDNGDVVTACSDGVVRMWTTDNNRFCSDEELAAYTDIISQYTLSRKTVGGLKLMDLPRVEALQVQGHTTTMQPCCSILEEIIIWEIIPRLPAKAFLRCRTVCRLWRLVLTSNRELLLQHHRDQPSLPIASCMERSDCTPVDYDLRAFDPRAGTLSPFAGFRYHWLILRASCDGLLVLSAPEMCFYVCNPSTREWLSLPFFAHFLGFYPHRSSGEYRILYRSSPPPVLGPYDEAFYYTFTGDPEDYKHSYHIYTLGSEERRCISRPAALASVDEALAEGSVNTSSHHPSVLFREDLHFYPVNKQGSNMIMVFSTTAESFHWMSAPAIPKSAKSSTLFEMDGKLVLYGIDDDVTMVNICMLQDYDNQVWEFKYKVELPVAELRLSAAWFRYISPVVCEKGGVLLSMYGRLVHIDTLGNVRSDIRCSGRDLWIMPHKLRESLLHHTFFPSQPSDSDFRPLL